MQMMLENIRNLHYEKQYIGSSKKLKVELPSSNSASGYLPKGNKNTYSKRHMHPNVYCSIIHGSQDMKAT